MNWAYGVMTVPQRVRSLLPTTLQSLADAGFDTPRLFIDGAPNLKHYEDWKLQITCRYPRVKAYGNWFLSLWELYVRHPKVDRYAIFQDDLVCVKNLRQYLEAIPWPGPGYLNLYNVPQNEKLKPKDFKGFYPSNQMGRGALALVFDAHAVEVLLMHPHMFNKPKSNNGWRSVDGAVVTAMKKAKHKEFVHKPSLIQHTGRQTTLGNSWKALPESFPGVKFDAMELIP